MFDAKTVNNNIRETIWEQAIDAVEEKNGVKIKELIKSARSEGLEVLASEIEDMYDGEKCLYCDWMSPMCRTCDPEVLEADLD